MFIFSLPLVKNLAERDQLLQQVTIQVIADISVILNRCLPLDPWLPVSPRYWEMPPVGMLSKRPEAGTTLPQNL